MQQLYHTTAAAAPEVKLLQRLQPQGDLSALPEPGPPLRQATGRLLQPRVPITTTVAGGGVPSEGGRVTASCHLGDQAARPPPVLQHLRPVLSASVLPCD